MTQFRLYPEERPWWSFSDYQAVLDVMSRLRPLSVLEFGPGSSTLALIEGGARTIQTCEDDPEWFAIQVRQLEDVFPSIVRLVPYTWTDPLLVSELIGARFDLALIDGPKACERRLPVIEFALTRADAVLVPTEDDGHRETSFLRPLIAEVAQRHACGVEIIETGPWAGGFALLTPGRS